MEMNTRPPNKPSRFAHFPIPSAWRQEAWKAKRHGEFQRRFPYAESASSTTWPFNCRYFSPHTMNAAEAMDLNARDTAYLKADNRFPCIDFTDAGPREYSVQLGQVAMTNFQELADLPPLGTKILFLPQSRLYSTSRSTIQLSMQVTTWESLLTALMIPPTVVELLHDNNGGSWQHVSHCGDNDKIHTSDAEHVGPCAYHICFKTSQFELAYARHDFHSKRNLILVMGDRLDLEIQRLTSQFKGLCPVHLFHVLLAIVGTWLQKLEQSRWSLDFDVLRLEQHTGFGQSFQNLQRGQLPELRKSTAEAQIWMKSVVRHSKCVGKHFKVLAEALPRFQVLQEAQDKTLKDQILDAIAQYQSQQESQAGQAQDLSWRIDTQWNVLVALLAKNDSDVTIAMAQDARADSLLMRKLAVVSIVFLPATFLATFFSMMFFQVDVSGSLSINQNIWVYFVATSAMSLLIGLYFRFGKHCKSFATTALQKVQRKSGATPLEKLVSGSV